MTMNANFSCDLADLAQKHIYFLEQCHAHGVSLNPSTESLHRYRYLWLPLVAQHAHAQLIPPPDVAWLWHCHRLAPVQYSAYCQELCGQVLEANPPFALSWPNDKSEPNSNLKKTQTLWRELYPSESFFLSDFQTKQQERDESAVAEPLLDFDLMGSAKRQAGFLWQVSGVRFSDPKFIQQGVNNYARFLMLTPMAKELHILLVPTYQIDLIWHTHMLSSMEKYNLDCVTLMNSTMSHDDSLTDRSTNGTQRTNFEATSELWRNVYDSDYNVQGGMYRGEPPVEFYSPQWTKASSGVQSRSTAANAWVPLNGTTSDGQPAFIRTYGQTKREIRSEARRDNYILGRHNNVTGFYHIETREAHAIMVDRMNHMVRQAESNVAFQQGCCGGGPAGVQVAQRRLASTQQARAVWTERLGARNPSADIRTRELESNRLTRDDGTWTYPPVMFTYGGGGCGGSAATCGDGGGGGAGCGGGCGGGGGGGGCGGGGCGG